MVNKENCEEQPRSNLAHNSNVFRSQEDYITQVSLEIKGTVTKKLSQEFSRFQNRILGALSCVDDFLKDPLTQGHAGTAPETYPNAYGKNQATNEDDSQIDLHPQAGVFQSQKTLDFIPQDGHNIVTGDN